MLLTELKEFKTKLEYHHKLNPAIWDDDVLKPEVLEKFKEITKSFIDYLDLGSNKVKDIIFTGSNTNFNWTELSDIDLHVVVDTDDDSFDAKKTLWNTLHDISIHGFKVELYVETNKSNQSGNSGLFSVKDGKWLREPKFENIKFDYDKIKKKAAKWMLKIDSYIKDKDVEDLTKLKHELQDTRRKDLASGGEFTMENLVYKSLRNNGYLDKLLTAIRKYEDQKLSLK